MNIIKLQQDLLSLVKRDHDIGRMHDVVDDKFYLANEKGTALYIIPECLWYLSENIFSNPPSLAKSIVEEYSNIKADGYISARLTRQEFVNALESKCVFTERCLLSGNYSSILLGLRYFSRRLFEIYDEDFYESN